MSKLLSTLKKIFLQFLVFSLMLIILYVFGRAFQILPPLKAIDQLVKIHKIRNNYGEESIEYSSALDSLADIYYKKDFDRRGKKYREKALFYFRQGNHQNSTDYALSLFKYTKRLFNEESEDYKETALMCKECFIELNKKNQLNDDITRKLVEIIYLTFEFETNTRKIIDEIKFAQDLNDSIVNKTEEDYQIRILLNIILGINYSDTHTFWIDAQNNFELALDLSSDQKYITENTYTKIFYARLLNKMQDYQKAKSILDSCPTDVITNEVELILYKRQLSDALSGLGDFAEAKKLLDDIEKLNFENDPAIQFATYYNKATNEIVDGNFFLSFYYMQRIKLTFRKEEIKNDQTLFNYYNLESLYCRRFNRSKVEYWTEKIEIDKISVSEKAIGLLFAETLIERLYKNEAYLEKTAELFKHLKRSVVAHFKYLTENQRMNYWYQYEIAIPMLYEAGLYSKQQPDMIKLCYDAALFSKGILLGSSIEFNKLLTESSDSSIIQNYYQLLEIRQIINSKTSKSIEKDSLTNISDKLERNLIQKSHEFGDYTQKMNTTWEDVHRSLNENDVAIEFIDFQTGEDSVIYAALLIRQNWEQPKMISLFSNNQLEVFLKNPPDSIYSGNLGLEIANLIWGNLLQYLNQNDNVFFSTTNLLHKLAIESLPLNDSVRVNEMYHLHRLSSTKQLCFSSIYNRIDTTVLYGGLKYSLNAQELIDESRTYSINSNSKRFRSKNNFEWHELPKTRDEVDSIKTLLAEKNIPTVLYTGEKGNEESFKNLSGKPYTIIHIATHGFFSIEDIGKNRVQSYYKKVSQIDSSLYRSGLILSGANKAWLGDTIPQEVEDGILTAQEVSTLNFRATDMVVLSACKTGLGEITSEGVFGLQRAFKKAGAETIIMSLWDVDDTSTSIFMTAYYRHLINGGNKHDAFLAAQQDVRSIKKYNSPVYWAAFIMLD